MKEQNKTWERFSMFIQSGSGYIGVTPVEFAASALKRRNILHLHFDVSCGL